MTLRWHNPTNGRRYQAILGRDLFGDWVLWRGWCGAGGKGGGEMRQALHDTAVVPAIRRLCRRREVRGYLPVGEPVFSRLGLWRATPEEVAQVDAATRRAMDALVEFEAGDAAGQNA
ncbi:MAG: hypothetical protein ACREXW_00890 [Gammaproteobacteria bacterium]